MSLGLRHLGRSAIILIDTPAQDTLELYDLQNDPSERVNLTTAGSFMLAGSLPPDDAFLVAR